MSQAPSCAQNSSLPSAQQCDHKFFPRVREQLQNARILTEDTQTGWRLIDDINRFDKIFLVAMNGAHRVMGFSFGKPYYTVMAARIAAKIFADNNPINAMEVPSGELVIKPIFAATVARVA